MNNNVNKRTSSIARGINTAFWFNKLKAFFTLDILIILSSFGLFCYSSYKSIPEDEMIRRFTISGENYNNVVLNLFTENAQYDFPMREYIYFVGIILIAVIAYQLLNLLGSFPILPESAENSNL